MIFFLFLGFKVEYMVQTILPKWLAVFISKTKLCSTLGTQGFYLCVISKTLDFIDLFLDKITVCLPPTKLFNLLTARFALNGFRRRHCWRITHSTHVHWHIYFLTCESFQLLNQFLF